MNEFVDKNENAYDECGNKNTFGRLVAMGINVDCKKYSISQQRNAADGCQKGLICTKDIDIFREVNSPAENPEIINGHGEQGPKETQYNSKFKVVFLVYQNFQDFSSLVFKT
jgi:hypothetical protein